MRLPASGKAVGVTGMVLFRLENSRMAEAWLNLDVLSLLQQVGIIPVAA
jgi:predicted ester cyclase